MELQVVTNWSPGFVVGKATQEHYRRLLQLGASFIAGTRQAAPQADIVHDRFHVPQPLDKAVNQTRREKSARMAAQGEDTLKHTRLLWLHGTAHDERSCRCRSGGGHGRLRFCSGQC